MPTRHLLAALVIGACAFGGAAAQSTSSYPSRPIRLIVPFPAGGSSDILGRTFADKLAADLGQPVIVDNRAGANTVLGTQAAASAKADGYTLLQVTPNAAIIASLQANLPYDLHRDLTPVIGVGSVPLLLVVPAQSNTRSMADLVALAKSKPGGLSYASGGIGSLGHLVSARFARDLKASFTHVPYRGVAPALQDVVGGRIDLMFVSSIEGVQVAKSGQVRVLAVTSEQRMPSLPEAPTMTELGHADFTPAVWYGFLAPANTSVEIVDRLHKAFASAANDAGVRDRLTGLGLTVKIRSAADQGKFMREEQARWGQVVRDNDIKLE